MAPDRQVHKARTAFCSWYEETLQKAIPWFDPEEILVGVDRYPNEMPERKLWPNIVPTLVVLNQLRDYFGRPIVISSCYRNLPYNAQIKGALYSTHQAFLAVDFAVASVAPAEVAKTLLEWRGKAFPLPVLFTEIDKRVTVSIPFQGYVPMKELKVLMQSTTTVDAESWSLRHFVFAGGVGEYAKFTHLDTRGINTTWRGKRG